MNAVFSKRFKDDLLQEEVRYAEVSERLARYVATPVPKSVQNVLFEGNDYPFAFECQCFLAFSASSNDLNQIVRWKGMHQVTSNDMYGYWQFIETD